jgi:hypothetical protein
VAELRERISVSKQARQKFDLERFDLRKLDDIGVMEWYQVEILIDLLLWSTLMRVWSLIVLGKALEKISRPHPRKARISQAKV